MSIVNFIAAVALQNLVRFHRINILISIKMYLCHKTKNLVFLRIFCRKFDFDKNHFHGDITKSKEQYIELFADAPVKAI